MRSFATWTSLVLVASCGGGNGNGDDGLPGPDAAPPSVVCDAPALVDVSAPTAVVGDGSAASCTPCLRLFRRPDGTVLTSDCPVGKRRRRNRLVAAGVAIAAAAVGLLGFATRGTVTCGSKPVDHRAPMREDLGATGSPAVGYSMGGSGTSSPAIVAPAGPTPGSGSGSAPR